MPEHLAANKGQMRKIIRMFETGNLSDLDRLIAPGYIDHQGLGGGAVTGPGGFRRVVESARGALKDLRVSIVDIIAEDDRVVVRLRWQAQAAGGTPLERQTIDIVRFVDCRAVEHWGAQC